ncbi:hypothetical protein K9U33_12135 [Rhodoblastus acidophilus]|uniref:Uncharacterized protein n=1 Tax=Candidatus Rhodoblastus alkanivorans TaxID=2954117 RepID=A0ABS9ZAY3_9HYPH|nr:hypothetical protein [Candidatus Rhodoblastus alkanivorans]MCI4679389.1 hypothetical protein [Candidatus Rhodoblastus alkanivorans]MCI4684865.1 hypothetical protein [Candidatus Rhodoblastus alkanivorans]
MEDMAGKGRCDQCGFWKMARPREGWCRRHAPKPSSVSDRISHWPTTHGGQGCGEFAAADANNEPVACNDCVYWHQPALGLQPVDRGDKLGSWWAEAGLCVRRAPTPVSEPGPRAFWCATHHADGCADGRHAAKNDGA